MQAWAPWDGYGWLLDALEDRDGATALSYARRAYTLSPFDMYVVRTLADKLLARGDREEVRNIALSLASGAYPVLQLASELLLVRVEASEASFGAALGRARRAMRIDGSDSGWTRVQRLDIAWQALEITEILGRRATATIADEIFTQFLMPEPPPLDGAHLDVPLRIPAICARATGAVAVRCFARFRSLRDRLSGGILPETDGFTKGAEHYARGELHLAARAWSPLLKEPAVFAPLMFEPMATTFERVGQSDQVERLSAAAPDRSVEFHGASLGVVRAARSAARHGERDKARTLARLDAWSVADVPVPAVQEMRRLVASYR
jgi:hypothetical protein